MRLDKRDRDGDRAERPGARPGMSDMGKLAPPTWQPLITASSDRATIAARLRRLNREAMEISRLGYAGTRSTDCEIRHATLDMMLHHWQMAHL